MPGGTPPTPRRPSPGDSSHTRWALIVVYVLAGAWGLRNVRPDRPSTLDLLVPVGLTVVLVWWLLADARRRGRPIPRLSRAWVLLFPWLAVPGYLVVSRGWRGAGWLVLHVVLWFVVVTFALVAGNLAVSG